MTYALILIIAGLALLIFGGDVLLRGAVGLATYFKLTPAVIGLTIVAAGTSVPELAVSAVAAWEGKTDITIGNIVGSNIFNIAAILGLVAIYRPLKIVGNTLKLEYPVLCIVTLLFIVLSQDGSISRLEALLFITIYVSFTAYVVKVVKNQLEKEEAAGYEIAVNEFEVGDASPGVLRSSIYTVIGVGLLGLGAELTVSGTSTVGQIVGLTERVIGLTIVGAGTGLPEVVTSFVSAYRGRGEIAIANVIGSNIFNILGILGITAAISPISIAQGIIVSDNWWLIAITLLLFPVMRSDFKISRLEGLFLFMFYVTYISILIL